MTSLAQKEALKGKVQMIYIDPPYGIKYGSNWQVSTRKRDVKDGEARRHDETARTDSSFSGHVESLGFTRYLADLRDRLCSARELVDCRVEAFFSRLEMKTFNREDPCLTKCLAAGIS